MTGRGKLQWGRWYLKRHLKSQRIRSNWSLKHVRDDEINIKSSRVHLNASLQNHLHLFSQGKSSPALCRHSLKWTWCKWSTRLSDSFLVLQVDPAKLRNALKTVIFNQVVISGSMVVAAYYLMSMIGNPCGPELPTFHRALMELAFFSLTEEIMFYYSHRFGSLIPLTDISKCTDIIRQVNVKVDLDKSSSCEILHWSTEGYTFLLPSGKSGEWIWRHKHEI